MDDASREAVPALSVREDQPFVAANETSLRQAAETNKDCLTINDETTCEKL
jgi:hypothetical protein